MTVTVANTANTNTFDFWRNRTNELAHAMSVKAVTVDSNAAVGNASVNGTITATSFVISNTSGSYILTPVTANTDIVVSGSSSNTLVDSFAMNLYNSAEYLLHVRDDVANNFFSTKILVTHDTTDSYLVDYGSITTNSALGYFSSYTNATHVSVTFNSTTTNATIKYARIIV